jgi:hypothetical protein
MIFGALERRARFVPWEDVEEWAGSTVRLRCRSADVSPVSEVY